MKLSTCLTFLVGLVAAAPSELRTTANDLVDGLGFYCPHAILIFARGSTEQGNLGTLVGPYLAQGLSAQVQSLWIQGIGGDYTAEIDDNFLPDGTSPEAIVEAYKMFNLAHEKCPGSLVLIGGYSQGAALLAATIPTLVGPARQQIKGAVLFGYTQNKKNDGRIPEYPADQTKVFCNDGDVVCQGVLKIKTPHLLYSAAAQGEGAKFLAKKISH
ncbi:unnamed protein product [Clonostachys solani]|uniref:cutinase n=1 Tax=Clonostachys solani TaxID=160281 RepID=A0A9N9YY94_9HYPO|nr:unnamed protein product [Clonostachys solani]